MKTKHILPVGLLAIIAVLGSCLVYEIVQNHRAEKGWQQIFISVAVQSYQGLDHGDADAVKQRMGAIAKAQSEHYEQVYGHETATSFAPMLAQADTIKAQVAPMSK